MEWRGPSLQIRRQLSGWRWNVPSLGHSDTIWPVNKHKRGLSNPLEMVHYTTEVEMQGISGHPIRTIGIFAELGFTKFLGDLNDDFKQKVEVTSNQALSCSC